MLALYPAANGGLFNGNPDIGIYNFVGAQTTPEDFGVARIDWNISEKDAFFARYEADFGSRTTNSGLGLWPLYDNTHNQFFTMGERHIFSPNLINQFTASLLAALDIGNSAGGTRGAADFYSRARGRICGRSEPHRAGGRSS